MIVNKTDAMVILAGQLDVAKGKKGDKFFSFERCESALKAVIKESGDKSTKGMFVRTHTAALLAVHFQDERSRAEKDGARKGYVMLLDRLERVATERVFKYDPQGSWLTRSYPGVAAKLMTPERLYAAQAEVEIREAPEKEAKRKAKEAAKAAA
jgi:hypothetical protein